MAEFVWEARGRAGESRKGVMEADSEAAVEERLRSQALSPTKVKKKAKEFNITIGSGVGLQDIVTFTRLFSTMINAGLPIVQCLDILGSQTENKFFANVLKDVKSGVESGMTLSDALRKHPKVFDDLYTNLVQAGEAGGILDTVLQRLAQYAEKSQALRRQVKGAMIYPSVVLVIFVGVLGVLLGYVIPSFKVVFKDLSQGKASLPALTEMVITASELFRQYFPLIFLISVASIWALVWWYRQPRGKFMIHTIALRVPVFGPLLRKVAVARFTRTLGTLLNSGVPILDALDIVAKTAGNVVVEQAIQKTRTKISEGQNMAGPLLETNIFPPMVVQMVGVGEQTGALDAMLSKIADFYEDEVDVAVGSLTKLIEPAMMVLLGGTVGVVLIAMYLPIFSMAGAIKSD